MQCLWESPRLGLQNGYKIEELFLFLFVFTATLRDSKSKHDITSTRKSQHLGTMWQEMAGGEQDDVTLEWSHQADWPTSIPSLCD